MALQIGDWWTSGNGNIYRYAGTGDVQLVGKDDAKTRMGIKTGMDAQGGTFVKQIADPFHGQGQKEAAAPKATTPTTIDSGSGVNTARLGQLRGQLTGLSPEIERIYAELFGGLEGLLADRTREIEETTGRSINDLTKEYVGAIPGIETSFAALGAADSTDSADAKDSANAGYKKSVEEVGRQKDADLTKLGTYGQETKAGWDAERDALRRLVSRAGETQNESELLEGRNNVENQLGRAKAAKASLTSDQGMRDTLAGLTDSSSRLGSIQESLNSILGSSMAGGVKEAATLAAQNSAGLTDEEKDQVKRNNPYQTNQ